MTLQHLWAAWRHEYITGATADERAGRVDECVFCAALSSGPPSPANGIVWRGERAFVILNAYPYASGHVLVLPVRHISGMEELSPEESADLWEATRSAIRAIEAAYNPDGLNMGANLGRAAGAGIPRHLHLHALPRWSGDTNFMTSVGGVRVMPEALTDSWRRLHDVWTG